MIQKLNFSYVRVEAYLQVSVCLCSALRVARLPPCRRSLRVVYDMLRRTPLRLRPMGLVSMETEGRGWRVLQVQLNGQTFPERFEELFHIVALRQRRQVSTQSNRKQLYVMETRTTFDIYLSWHICWVANTYGKHTV